MRRGRRKNGRPVAPSVRFPGTCTAPSATSSGAPPKCRICHEDSDSIAFMDIQPVNNGHVLVVPREHYESLARRSAGDRDASLHRSRCDWPSHTTGHRLRRHEHRREQRRGGRAGRAALSRPHHSAPRGRRLRHPAAVQRIGDAGPHRARCLRGADHLRPSRPHAHRRVGRGSAVHGITCRRHERSLRVPVFDESARQ